MRDQQPRDWRLEAHRAADVLMLRADIHPDQRLTFSSAALRCDGDAKARRRVHALLEVDQSDQDDMPGIG